MSTLRTEGEEVILCCGKGKCPRIGLLPEDKVLITDDDNNKIVLTKEQALLIERALLQLQQK